MTVGETKQAEVVAVDLVHVVIICPFCGKFHWHGSNGLLHEANYGSRVPHCGHEDANLRHGEYELVTTGGTIRKPALSPKDLKPWHDDQRSARAAILERRREQEAAEIDRRIFGAVRELRARGRRLQRWRIANQAAVPARFVTGWMHRHGIYYGDGRYQVISRHQAGPELCTIFGDQYDG